MIRLTIYSILLLLLYSCCPSQKTAERKISRFVECNPQLSVKDTIEIKDTIYIDKISLEKDTVITRDTTYLEKDGVKIKIVRRDTIKEEIPIYISAECPPDTITKTIKVPTGGVKVEDKRVNWKYTLSALIVGIVLTLLLFRRN